MGKDGFIWWQGVVEDRHDPLYLGRCRIRILGWHTENRTQMPTESLPWSYPILPLNSDQGQVHAPKEGTRVVGFFRDGEAGQHRYIFGTVNTRLSDG